MEIMNSALWSMWEILNYLWKSWETTNLASQKNEGTYNQLLLSKDKEQCQLLAECAAEDTGGCSEGSRMEGLNGW